MTKDNKSITDMDVVSKLLKKARKKKDRKVVVPVKMSAADKREPLKRVQIITHTSNYELQVDDECYLYFTPEHLFAGFLYHFGLGERACNDLDHILKMTAAAMTWIDHKELIAELNSLRYKNTQLEKQIEKMELSKAKTSSQIKTATSILNGRYNDFRANLSLLDQFSKEEKKEEED